VERRETDKGSPELNPLPSDGLMGRVPEGGPIFEI